MKRQQERVIKRPGGKNLAVGIETPVMEADERHIAKAAGDANGKPAEKEDANYQKRRRQHQEYFKAVHGALFHEPANFRPYGKGSSGQAAILSRNIFLPAFFDGADPVGMEFWKRMSRQYFRRDNGGIAG